MHWRRKWQPTPVFLPGESQGQGSLVGCRLWGRTVKHAWSNLAAAAAGKDWRQEEKRATENEMVGWHTDSINMSLSKLQEIVKDREAWHAAVHGVAMNWPWLSDWTATNQAAAAKPLSRVWLFATPWTAAHQAPPSMGFSRQEYWSGVPLPSPNKLLTVFLCGMIMITLQRLICIL